MMRKYAGVLALVAAASMTAGCGLDGSAGAGQNSSEPPRSQQASSQSSAEESSSATSPSATSAVSRFCSHIAPGGDHPADAFMEISLFQATEARKTALAEAKLLKGAVPPPAIARDFKAWRSFVQAVVRTTAHGGSMESVSPLADRAQAAQQKLTDYAFAHCA